MTELELTELLSEAFPGAQVSVALEGGHVGLHGGRGRTLRRARVCMQPN